MSERAKLLVRPPSGRPTEYILDKTRTRVGRHGTNDLIVGDLWSSKFHADILERDGVHYIKDCSKNGTRLNYEPILRETWQPLHHADVIQIGDTEIVYLLGKKDVRALGESLVVPSEYLLSSVTGPQSSWDRNEGPISSGAHLGPDALLRHHRILSALSAASRALAGRHSTQELLDYSLRLVFDTVAAERGFIAILRGNTLETRARRIRKRLKDASKESEFSRSIAAKVIGERVSILIPDALRDPALSHMDSISEPGVRSAACAPLWDRKSVAGVLYVDNLSRGNQFDADDLTFLTSLANMIAMSLTNADMEEKLVDKKRLDGEAEKARLIVAELLPRKPPSLPGWDLAASSTPCYEVGGDYFDFVPGPRGRIILAVGDVAGNGLPAAMMMVLLRAAVRAAAGTASDIRDIAAHAHTMLLHNSPANLYATLFLADLDPETGEIRYINAGHVPPLLGRAASRRFERLEIGGPPAGLLPVTAFDAGQVVMEPGDVLSVVSDGITEAGITEAGEELDRVMGLEGVERVMDMGAGAEASELMEAILEEAERRSPSDKHADDTTVMVVRRWPLSSVGSH